MKKYLSLLLLFNYSVAFAILGSWNLTYIKQYSLLLQAVSINVTDQIYLNSSVIQNLSVTGCYTYSYNLEVIQDNLFVDPTSFEAQKYTVISNSNSTSSTNSTNSSQCSTNLLYMHTIIQSYITTAFKFNIFSNVLVFLSPTNQTLLQFSRIVLNNNKDIIGVWNLYRVMSNQTSQSTYIFSDRMIFCYGNLTVGYQWTGNYSISTTLIQNSGCQINGFQELVLSIKYLKKVGPTTLQIFDKNVTQIMELQYYSQISNSSLNTTQAQNTQSQSLASGQSQSGISNISSASLTGTIADFIGRWFPTSIFGSSLNQSPIYLTFTQNSLSYNGGCSDVIFQYSINLINKSFSIGKNITTNGSGCVVNDDQLYFTAINMISSFEISAVGASFELNLYDSGKNSVFQLVKNVVASKVSNLSQGIQNSSTVPNNSSSYSVANQSSNSSSSTSAASRIQSANLDNMITAGSYLMLLLSRRDLPRLSVNVTNSTLSYQGCNQMVHNIQYMGNMDMKVTGGKVTNQTCKVDNDKIYMNLVNSVTAFAFNQSGSTYQLLDSSNTQIINLSLF